MRNENPDVEPVGVLTLVGILAHPFDLPGYVCPVFENKSAERFTQIADQEEKIASFSTLRIADSRFLPVNSFPQIREKTPRVWTRAIGNPLLLAFKLPSRDVLIAEAQYARLYLKEHIGDFEQTPTVQASIARFCREHRARRKASKKAKRRETERIENHIAKRRAFEKTAEYLKDATHRTVHAVSKWVLSEVFPDVTRSSWVVDGVVAAVDQQPSIRSKFRKGVSSALESPAVQGNPTLLLAIAQLAARSQAESAVPILFNAVVKLQQEEQTLVFAEQIIECLRMYRQSDNIRNCGQKLLATTEILTRTLPMVLDLLMEVSPGDTTAYIQKYQRDLDGRGGLSYLANSLSVNAGNA